MGLGWKWIPSDIQFTESVPWSKSNLNLAWELEIQSHLRIEACELDNQLCEFLTVVSVNYSYWPDTETNQWARRVSKSGNKVTSISNPIFLDMTWEWHVRNGRLCKREVCKYSSQLAFEHIWAWPWIVTCYTLTNISGALSAVTKEDISHRNISEWPQSINVRRWVLC